VQGVAHVAIRAVLDMVATLAQLSGGFQAAMRQPLASCGLDWVHVFRTLLKKHEHRH
jgi:hypothetical protein